MRPVLQLALVVLLAALGLEVLDRLQTRAVPTPEPANIPAISHQEPSSADERSNTPPLRPSLPPVSPWTHPAAPLPPPLASQPEPVVRTAPASPLAIPPPPTLTDQELYARLAASVIQIYCRTPGAIFSASGVVVNERGLVLTNAHVAEVVKRSGESNCQARHGNPADPFAGLEIVFTASTTAKIAETQVPQRDLAFLKIRDSREPFGVAAVAATSVKPGETLYSLGYPSEFLEGVAASAYSNLVFSKLRVDALADVDGNPATAEGYAFRGGIVLQQGSSGTALFTGEGTVVGLIFATTKGATTADREGIALMTPYLDGILRLETGQSLADFIAGH